MAKRIWLARRWRHPIAVLVLFAVELMLLIPTLALFGIADPDLYRTKLWRDGFRNGFNSDPDAVLLRYSNHLPVKVPLVWSQFITTWNLVICILSAFLLLVKSVMFVLNTWYPLLSLAIHGGTMAVYIYSAYGQLGSDKSDPLHLLNGPPWYITKSCNVALDKRLIDYCKQAKASAGVTIAMACLLFFQVVLALLSVVPSRQEKEIRGSYDDDEEDEMEGPYYDGQGNMYKNDGEKPPNTATFYGMQDDPRSPLPLQRSQEKQPAKSAKEQEAWEMSVLQQHNPDAYKRQSQQQSFATNLMHTYLQHSSDGQAAITASQPTPNQSHPAPYSPRPGEPLPSSMPFFAPPPTAPTPRTTAFNILAGKTGRKKAAAAAAGPGSRGGRNWWGGRKEREESGASNSNGFQALQSPTTDASGRVGGTGTSGALPFRSMYGS